MTEDFKQEVLDVRKVIEKSTSKVSLRDLEKKGFRQVKVLRAGDINQLISNAVRKVMAKQPPGALSEEERKRIEREAKAEVDRQLAEKRALMQEKQAVEQEKVRIEDAKQRLEDKVAELNRQIMADKRAFEEEKRQFEQRQALFEKSLAGQEVTTRSFEGQLQDLRDRLANAISKGEHDAAVRSYEEQLAELRERANGAVPRDEHQQMRERAKKLAEELEEEAARYRAQVRQLEEDNADLPRLRRRAEEAEESEQRARQRIQALTEEVERLEEQVRALKSELAEASAGVTSGAGAVDNGELERMRLEIEQRDASMREMIANLAKTITEVKPEPVEAGAAAGGDMAKQFKQLQLSLSDQLRKSLGSLGGGKDMDFGDMSPEALGRLISNQADVEMKTNINEVELKETKGAGVKDKLAKLRNLRKPK